MNVATNPYAAGLRDPGRSKRAWDATFIDGFHGKTQGDPVRFELTDGVVAEGVVKILQFHEGTVSYVSGELTAPEKGTFFFITPPKGGKAGKAVGVIEFPASETAYRIEPTGEHGEPELWMRHLDEVVCVNMEEVDHDRLAEQSEDVRELVPLRPDQVPDPVPDYNDGIVSLQSYPGSSAVMLLDFAGGYTSSWGGVTYARPNVSNATIKDIWKRVAEDYMPFNINVTTDIQVFLAAPAASRQRCCYTTTPITAAGVAYFGSWNWGNDTVCWSVYYVGKAAAEVGSHEVGHTLGLSHQGQNGGNEYFGGHGGGETGWAPIMGVGYYQPVTTWAKGDYENANQPQDELDTIVSSNNNVACRDDDTGDTLAASRYLEVYPDRPVFAEGVIERAGDTDAFQFTTTGGTVHLTVDPVAPGDWGNLATMATLADASGAILATANDPNDVSSTLDTNLAAGTYTFRVTGAGKKDPMVDGFTDYGSLGYYSISGTIPGAWLPTRLSVAERAPVNTIVGTVPADNPNSDPLVYTITSGNTGGTFSLSNTGEVRVADNSLLDYYALAADPSRYAVQFELFVDITNSLSPALSETNRRVVIAVDRLYAPTPAHLTATLESGLRVSLDWGASYGATGYLVKRSTTPGGPYTDLATTGSNTYSDTAVTHGVTYHYVVTALNENGGSNPSNEASVLARSVAGGFESPVLGTGAHQYAPEDGVEGWSFGGAPGNGSGIVTNGSAFNNPAAPEGVQAAFVQTHGAISQTLSGFTPGTTYTVSYLAAQRPGNQQTWDVKIDNSIVQSASGGGSSYAVRSAIFTATATYHTLSFVGTNSAGGDNTVFIDNVQVLVATPLIPNFSFETPGLGSGSGAYVYAPTGASWTFNGASGNGSGIAANGSAFSNPDAPHGSQVAFVQNLGIISQTLTGFTPGKTYTLTYLAAQRPGGYGGQTWDVKVEGNVIQSNGAGSNAFTCHTANFVASAESQTLSFAGTNLSGGDRTVFIDSVGLAPADALLPITPGIVLGTSGNQNAFGVNAPVGFTASVTANGNAIDGVRFFVDHKQIGEASESPFTCVWTDPEAGVHTAFARVLFNNGSSADSVAIRIAVSNHNLNLGFETPALGGSQYQYHPPGASWSFNDSGIASNGSGFNNTAAPEGSQIGFVQYNGATSQTFTGFTPGIDYTISYMAAQRPGNQQTWDVKIDGTPIQSFSGGGSGFAPRSATFTATSDFHTLIFEGTNLNGGDNTIFIDQITFVPPLATNPGPALVADITPATATDVAGSDVTFVAYFSTPLPTTYQWQKIVDGQVFEVPGATTTTLRLSNLQPGDAGRYRLRATNSAGVSVSGTGTLSVNPLPAPVGNVIASHAAQTGRGATDAQFSPTWEIAPGSLIATQSPSAVGTGGFSNDPSVLTDGATGRSTFAAGGPTATQVTCGGGAGQSLTYNLGTSPGGCDLSRIVVYGGWPDAGRDQQAYTVSYSTVSDPTNFIQLAAVENNPSNPLDIQCATRSTLASVNSDPLASSVAALKFDFTTPEPENGYCGYSEIAVYGTPPAPTVTLQTSPATAADVLGGQVTFTASIAGAAPLIYQWQKVVGGVPSDIDGANSQSLTLANLQTSDSASYQLKAANSYGSVTSAASTLIVTAAPAPVNNVITSMAAQTGLGGNTTFNPSWTLTADDSLISGVLPAGAVGDFSLNDNGKTASALTAIRSLAISPKTGGENSFNYLSCGNGNGAGSSVIYTLPANPNGYSLHKIVVHGGWADAGRDQQAYTVSYSKVDTPTSFVVLRSVNYNPGNPFAVQSTTRSTLTAASGVLATEVAAVKFDFTTPGSENGWVGYSQLAVYGAPSLSIPAQLIASAGDAQASMSWTATPNATAYNVKRSTVSGGPYSIVGSVPDANFVNTGLTNGTTYYYVVTAWNGIEESPASNQVSVTPVSAGYNGWLEDHPALSGPDRSPDADPDHDGMPNGIEFLTGSSPVDASSRPSVSSNMDGSGAIVLHFQRVDAAKLYTVAVESTTDFQPPWSSVIIPTVATNSLELTVVENGAAPDDITVRIPPNGAPGKFARIRITIPSSP